MCIDWWFFFSAPSICLFAQFLEYMMEKIFWCYLLLISHLCTWYFILLQHTTPPTHTHKRFTFNFLGTSLHLGFFDLHVFWTFQLNFMLVCCLSILSLASLPPLPGPVLPIKLFCLIWYHTLYSGCKKYRCSCHLGCWGNGCTVPTRIIKFYWYFKPKWKWTWSFNRNGNWKLWTDYSSCGEMP